MALLELEPERLGGRLYAESLANVLAVHLLRHYTSSLQQDRHLVGGMSGQKLHAIRRLHRLRRTTLGIKTTKSKTLCSQFVSSNLRNLRIAWAPTEGRAYKSFDVRVSKIGQAPQEWERRRVR
jgi:AraC family transcriptional regulator